MEESLIFRQRGKDARYKVWHRPCNNMIIYVHSGEGSIVCGERVFPINCGTLCFVGNLKYHYTMPDNFEGYERSKVFISNEELKNVFDLLPVSMRAYELFSAESLVYAQIDESDTEEIERIFDEIKAKREEKYASAFLYCAFARLLCYIDKNSVEPPAITSNGKYKPIEYINRHICEELSIDSICAELHVSKYHFCRQFKKITGMTVMEYVLRTRIVMAENMLLREDSSITDIGYRCGFASISYFSRVFKEQTGLTPTDYRKKKK